MAVLSLSPLLASFSSSVRSMFEEPRSRGEEDRKMKLLGYILGSLLTRPPVHPSPLLIKQFGSESVCGVVNEGRDASNASEKDLKNSRGLLLLRGK